MTAHLQSLGVTANTRVAFIKQLQQYKETPINLACWEKQVIKLRES